ncbi:CAP domain-containing protein [Paraconexibacter sp.]|uniref:CAP domain-containing protein n=1 Tax=Paraconexibacter sp. TaxID=2949640 RepID=UPI00356616A3
MGRGNRIVGLAFVLISITPGAAVAAPAITKARLSTPAVTDRPAALVVRAVDRAAPVSGFSADLEDGTRTAASACRTYHASKRRLGRPFRAGDAVRFVLRPTFADAGATVMQVRVVAGRCGAPGKAVEQPFRLTVTRPGEPLISLLEGLPATITDLGLLPPLPATRGARARAARTKPCTGASQKPWVKGFKQARRATLCLINRERGKRGLRRLREDKLLGRAASRHSRAMVRKGFFAHTGPDGVDLTARARKAGWPRNGARRWQLGENIGLGTGSQGTPRAVVRSWMDSSGHRANLLDPAFDRIGLSVVRGTPGGTRSGATYTTDFGRVER